MCGRGVTGHRSGVPASAPAPTGHRVWAQSKTLGADSLRHPPLAPGSALARLPSPADRQQGPSQLTHCLRVRGPQILCRMAGTLRPQGNWLIH